MERWIPSFSVHRPVTVIMSFVALMLVGVLTWTAIPLEMMPSSFSLNRLWVWISYDGSTPRENDANIIQPLQEQVSTAPGIKSMGARARAGSASLSLEFHRSISMDVAYNALVDRLERAMPELPEDVERYNIWKWDPADEPIIWAGISIPDAVEDDHKLVSEVVAKRLERVPGVGQVEFWGVTERRIFIEFRLDQLAAHGVNLGEVLGRLGQDNFQMASGRVVDGGRVAYVRSLARWEDVETLRAYPVKPGVRLGDIADITYRPDPSPDINHINGKDGAAIAIKKESDANTVEVAEQAEAVMAELEADPRAQGATFVKFFSQADMITDSLNELLSSTVIGGLCAVVVLFVFLREWRLTLLIAACIPVTLLMTVSALYFTGHTLNLLTLMGLMLAVGMVVDNAIVVVEAIYERRQRGEGLAQAAVDGASEVNLAITLSTLTSMVVFLPIILMSQDADFSFFMGELGMPVVWALGASLVVALLYTPLATTFLKDKAGTTLPPAPAWVGWLERRYQAGLRAALTHRTDTLLAVVGMIFLTVVLPAQSVSCEESADGNIGDFVVRLDVPLEFTYAERLKVIETYEKWVDAHDASWGVRTHRAELDATSSFGRIYVYLDEEPAEGQLDRALVLEQARAELPKIAGVDAGIGWSQGSGNENTTITVTLSGEDVGTLETLGLEVRRRLKGVPGVVGATNDQEEGGGEELRLRADRDALARGGLDARSVGQTVGFALRGTLLPRYHEADKEVDVVARFRYEDRQDIDRLLDFPLWSPATGASQPLRTVVQPEVAPGLGTIRREDRITSYPITVELKPGTEPGEVQTAIAGALQGLDLPRGYDWSLDGRAFGSMEDDQARNLALLLSIVFVFLIMGVLFESFLLPFSIITSIPMALLGVYWTLYLTGTPLDLMAGVGLVILIGVVVNNGIVLIDLVTRLRAEGMSRVDALVEAGGRRLRPILMTALTTIIGLMPMALGDSTFVGIPYAPLGRVVAGGMVTGTVLTLFLVPFLYTVLDDIRATAGRWLAWIAARPAAAAAR